MAGHDLVLRHVRAHGRARDWIPARIWLDQALRDVLDGLPGVAPEATLLVCSVRHMRAPPRRSAGGGSAELMRWRGALRAELSGLARAAGRPARGAVPASAPAVLFADAAELLSCLAQNWLSGALSDRWWWQMLPGVVDEPARAVGEAWVARPRHVPAALELLGRTGQHVAFAAGLPLATVTELTTAVAEEWAAPWLAPAAERAAPMPAPVLGAADTDVPPAGAAPWRVVAPEVPEAGLRPASQLLLGAGLMLNRAPAWALAAPTGVAVRRWLAALEAASRAASADVSDEPTAPERTAPERSAAYTQFAPPLSAQAAGLVSEPLSSPPTPEAIAPAGSAERALAQPPPSVQVAEDQATPGSRVPSAPPSSHSVRFGPEPSPGAPGRPAEREPAVGRAALGDSAAAAAEVPAAVARDSVAPLPPAPSARSPIRAPAIAPQAGAPRIPGDLPYPPAAGLPGEVHRATTLSGGETTLAHTVSTQLGGIFYLLQPALMIGHYGDFSMPGTPGLALSPWDWLGLVGTHLMPRASSRDPVWGLLSQLAGRSLGEPPGQGFHAPRCWRVDPACLRALPSPRRPWSWAARDGRLVVRHPLGFVVVDVPVHGERSRQLSAEMRRYGPQATLPAAHPLPIRARPSRLFGARLTPSLGRWREWTGEYVRAWLCCALGMPHRAAVGAFVIRRSARVRATAERVSITLALDELPFEIRLAGLDLDPGWIPAGGRAVAFHYQ